MSPILLACFLLCCGYIGSTEAGKGKGGRQGHIIIQNEIKDGKHLVPIYMPIPIPVPMPMGPPDGGRHSQQQIQNHHHHHQQNRNSPVQQHQEDEGEVKKIYLLQPIARSNSPPKQQNFHQSQIHNQVNTAPVISPPRFQMQSPQYDVGGLGGGGGSAYTPSGQEEYQSHGVGGGGGGIKQLTSHNMHSNDMKILPIVVIPPIAPMPPIQLQPNSHQQPQRVSVGSQINNYVSTIEPPYLSKTHRSLEQLHDFKTFSEYGGSGGGAVFRENLGPRRMRRRGPQMHLQAYRRSGSRLRPRYSEDYNEDYDYQAPPMIAHHRSFNHIHPPPRTLMPPRMHHRQRHTFHPEHPQLRLSARVGSMHDSIRDIIDQQVHFDDAEENRSQARSMENLTADNTDPKDSIAFLDDTMSAESVIGAKKPVKLASHQTLDKHSRLDHNGAAMTKQASDLTYYEHDIPHSNSELDNHKEAVLQSSNRIYSDERDALEDDEWWFDTMNSVSHVSPASSNQTTPIITNQKSTSTTTLAPSKA